MTSNIYLDSAHLRSISQLAETCASLRQLLPPSIKFRLVLDANFAIDDIAQKLRFPKVRHTGIEEIQRAGIAEIHAPRWLDTEMTTSTIPQYARKRDLDETALHELWDEYKAQLIFDDDFAAPEPIATAGDPKDVPYVKLAEAIAAHGILSNDKDIDQLGGRRLALDFVLSTREYARNQVYCVMIHFGGIAIAAVGWLTVHALVRSIASWYRSSTSEGRAIVVLVALVALLDDRCRNLIADSTRVLAPALCTAVAEIGDIYAAKSAAAMESLATVNDIVDRATSSPPASHAPFSMHRQSTHK